MIARYAIFSVFVGLLLGAIVYFYLPASATKPFETLEARQYLGAIAIFQAWIVLLLAWWVIYLPVPARWYLACCRMFAAVFFASSLSLAANFIPEKTVLAVGTAFNLDLRFNSSPIEVLLLAIVSAIFLDRFSRRYAFYREQA